MSSPTITKGETFTAGELVTPTKLNAAQTDLKPQIQTDHLVGRISASTGDWEEVPCSDFAQSLLDDANAAAARATLGVSELTASMATDKLLGRVSSGTGAPEEVTCTDFAQSLLDDTDAATARATLGVTSYVSAKCSTQTDVTSASYSDVTGMSVSVTSGTTYRLETIIAFQCPESPTNSGIKVKLTGTATVSAIEGIYNVATSTGLSSGKRIYAAAAAASLPVEVDYSIGVSYGCLHIVLTLACNGSGTLKWQVAQSAANGGTTSVRTISTMALDSY